MDRRHFIALSSCLPLCAGQVLAGTADPKSRATGIGQPSLLLSSQDPFSGLPLLKARYDRGIRPSGDMPGLALSWRLTGDNRFAEQALSQMEKSAPPEAAQAGRTWIDFIAWALAFDWLRGFAGFEGSFPDQIAHHLLNGAEKVLKLSDLADPSQVSYHNYSLRYLSLAAFALASSARHPATARRAIELAARVDTAFSNVLDLTQLVTPEGSYHESMDYSRITWVPLALMAELWRTTTGFDPAHRYSVLRNMGRSYLYKLMPDGTPSREGDNEYPVLDASDTTVLGYAVHRFKDPYAAWLLRESGFVPNKKWRLPVLAFLWGDDEVTPRNPALASERELPRQKYFPGVGHLVMRTGWAPESTWIEFDSGPYLAKHQHLAQNQFTIFHKGYLAIDSGADYTDTESPHYLNYYRRTVAHNTMLVFDPGEKFYWSENVLAAANDGGQRMDSSRFWNSVRSLNDWDQTKDLWDLAGMRLVDHVPGQYHYAFGDATRAYSPDKLGLFTRELLYDPRLNILYVYDRLHARPDFRKTWLLHGINEPAIEGNGSPDGPGGTAFRNASKFRFHEGNGELIVHALLPRERVVTRRGGPSFEFWTPGDEHGGPWGSGENWPLEPDSGSPLPSDQRLNTMWKKFWGSDFARILPSNRQNVKPGSWRIEVSPAMPNAEEVFLHVIEIGDRELKERRVELLEGMNLAGALVGDGSGVLFANTSRPILDGEVTLPGLPCESLLVAGLDPNRFYDIHLTGPNVASSTQAASPGVPLKTLRTRANEKGIAQIELNNPGNVRLRMSRV